jgi:16S rRNA (uracil1498-N3)-methyltransferase
MRLTRCFVSEALSTGSIVALPQEAAAHLTRVLRLRPGADLTVFDGRGGEYQARLLEPGAGIRARQSGAGLPGREPASGRGGARAPVQVEVREHRAVEREAPLPVTLLQCLARGERMDWIVQKATELGVATIVPLLSRHSVVQLDREAAARRLAHWRGVAIGACEQCGRNRLPHIAAPLDLQAACAAAAAADPPSLRLALSAEAALSLPAALQPAGRSQSPSPALSPAPSPAPCPAPRAIALLVGPEGGLAEPELAAALASGFVPCRLGPRILRAETAPLAALAALGALLGDLR